jgi:muconolactone delta-isomerase
MLSPTSALPAFTIIHSFRSNGILRDTVNYWRNHESYGHRHAEPLSQEQRQRYLPKEVPATLQLYLDGKMEQFWLRDKEAGVIFLMSVDSVDEADRLLKALPLGQADLLTFDLLPIGPLLPLGMLMKAK